MRSENFATELNEIEWNNSLSGVVFYVMFSTGKSFYNKIFALQGFVKRYFNPLQNKNQTYKINDTYSEIKYQRMRLYL